MEKKRPVGRPPKPDSEKLKLRQVRMTDEDYSRIAEAADRVGRSFSEFVRLAVLKKI